MGAVKRTHRRAVLFQKNDKDMRNERRSDCAYALYAQWGKSVYGEKTWKDEYMVNRTRESLATRWDELRKWIMTSNNNVV